MAHPEQPHMAAQDELGEKETGHHLEDNIAPGKTTAGFPVSPFSNITRVQALRKFWKVVIFSLLVAWTAIMDGYLITSEPASHFFGEIPT